jgi:hypothetical protein
MKQRPERIEPGVGQTAGEVRLGIVHEHGSCGRAIERPTAANGHPDHDFDRIDRGELTGIDDADLRHIERAGDAGNDGREDEHPELERLDRVAEEPRSALGVANRPNHAPGARLDDRAAEQ